MTIKIQEAEAHLAIVKAQLRFAMANRNWTAAKQLSSRFHKLAQNQSLRHIESHLYTAILYFHLRRWKACGMQLYLSVMAPYGTMQRRLNRDV